MADRRSFEIRSIGVIRSPFDQPKGAPIQPRMAGEAEGQVIVDEAYVEGLRDIEGFERIWLLYWFDRCERMDLTVTPFLDQTPHGLFATRAPCRPNRIGLSCVRLLDRRGATLRVGGIDVVDGSPLLDIKPYAPHFDVFAVERVGWLSGKNDRDTRADDRFE